MVNSDLHKMLKKMLNSPKSRSDCTREIEGYCEIRGINTLEEFTVTKHTFNYTPPRGLLS